MDIFEYLRLKGLMNGQAPQGANQSSGSMSSGGLLDKFRGMQYGPMPSGLPQNDFQQQALAPVGGVDTRAAENGTPDFNSTGAQAQLLGAQAMGGVSNLLGDPSRMGLLGAGLSMMGSNQQQPMPEAGGFQKRAFSPPMPMQSASEIWARSLIGTPQYEETRKRLAQWGLLTG